MNSEGAVAPMAVHPVGVMPPPVVPMLKPHVLQAEASRVQAPNPQIHSKTNLFVIGLPPDVDHPELATLFGSYGEIISSAVMRNIHTGESLGNGFVRFKEAASATKALAEISGTSYRGYTLTVQYAKKQHDNTPIGKARLAIKKLFVRNVPQDVTQTELSAIFGRFGALRKITLHKDTVPVTDKRLERRIAFVIFAEEGMAAAAVDEIHNTMPFPSCDGVPLMVKLADDQQHNHQGRGAFGGRQQKSFPNRSSTTQHTSPPPAYSAAVVFCAAASPMGALNTVGSPIHSASVSAPMGPPSPQVMVNWDRSQSPNVQPSMHELLAAREANHSPALSLPSRGYLSSSPSHPSPPLPAGLFPPSDIQIAFNADDASTMSKQESQSFSRTSSQRLTSIYAELLHNGASYESGQSPHMADTGSTCSGLSAGTPQHSTQGHPTMQARFANAYSREMGGNRGQFLPTHSYSDFSPSESPRSPALSEGIKARCSVSLTSRELLSARQSNCISPMSIGAGPGGRSNEVFGALSFLDDSPMELNLSRTHTPRHTQVQSPTVRFRHNPYDSSTSRVMCDTPTTATTS